MEVESNKSIEQNMGMGMGIGMGKETEEKKEGIKGKKIKKNKVLDQHDDNSKEQNKFFVDVSKDPESRDMILNLLAQANRKELGREIILKDLVLVALPKLTPKDIEKVQENCLTAMEKIRREWLEYNKKNSTELTFDEFLVKRLGIN